MLFMDTTPAPTTYTARVVVRHAATCKDKARGSDWRKCKCRKSLLVYDGGGSGGNRHISAKTRSWEKAEEEKQKWLDRFDPEKQELKRLRAEKERKQVRIEDAVALYLADMAARLGDNGTCAMARSLLGDVDPTTKAVRSDGHLFRWLATLPREQRPAYIAEITPAHLTAWRASWKFGDLTAANRWGMVKGFLSFCESQGWIADNPARRLKRPSVDRGNRTAIFSDEQYSSILDAVSISDPENVPAATRKAWQHRLTAFVELLRWSGMALVDATQWRPDSVDADGVLRYRRQKTGELATVPLPERLLILPRGGPLGNGATEAAPFPTTSNLTSDCRKWQHRLDRLFELAGITEVRTERGTTRKPHPHMLRDSFAVWHLRHGAQIRTVAKMLGHSNTRTTEKSYLPWCSELEAAHLADARQSLAAATPKPRNRRLVSIR